ncbi:VOC family protein [Geofilum rubicundum]|uniref:Glyoxalase family protein n=1 Tax=Geofilum rubicundum JCM 15548 TaxID=1236989 RepID=A0A0E9LW45_9BACT|nr:VOC family protein [Geofilum rubicundum]GAO29523.1 glyoxalase family protein [Geofilum rubicundum JCM 15548]
MEKLISWVEIPAADFQRAVKFYNKVLKLDMKGEDYGTEKMACFPSGEGAIVMAEGYAPSKNGVIVSLLVPDSIDLTVARIEENGGKLTHPKTKIEAEGMGYFAVFLDIEGNRIGLHEKL